MSTRAKAASLYTRSAIDRSIEITTSSDEVAELIRARQRLISEKEWTAERLFQIFDDDKNGKLDRDEIAKAITAMIERVPTEQQLEEMYGKYDANGDGAFDLEELKAMCKDELFKPKPKPKPKSVWRRMSLTKKKPPATKQEEKVSWVEKCARGVAGH